MKSKKILASILSVAAVASLAAASFSVSAEEVTEAPTSAPTEAPSTEATEPVTIISTIIVDPAPMPVDIYRSKFEELLGIEVTNDMFSTLFDGMAVEDITEEMLEELYAYMEELNEGIFVWDQNGTWSGSGDFTVTLPLENPDRDCGAFVSLTDSDDNPINGTAVLDGNGNLVLTISESYLKTLPAGEFVCFVEFENALMVYGIDIPQKSANNNGGTSNVPKTGSPKTGVKGIGLAGSLLAVSGVAAFISRKKKK